MNASVTRNLRGGPGSLLLGVSVSAFRMHTPNARNPRVNFSINPRVMPGLNPRVIAALDPRRNAGLNPRVNHSLNPRLNQAISPLLNRALDYRLNMGLNPRTNSRLDPRVNAALNPCVAAEIQGLYLLDRDLGVFGFTVAQSPDFWLVFDAAAELAAVAIRVRPGFYNLHDLRHQWIGYLVKASEKVLLIFDTQGRWIGSTS